MHVISPLFAPLPILSDQQQFKNENSSIITTSTGAAGIRFKQQNTLFKAKWYIKEVRSMGRIVW